MSELIDEDIHSDVRYFHDDQLVYRHNPNPVDLGGYALFLAKKEVINKDRIARRNEKGKLVTETC